MTGASIYCAAIGISMTTELHPADLDEDGRARLKLVAVAALVGVAAALVFVGWPALDLGANRLFYLEPRHFLFNNSDLVGAIRLGFKLLIWIAGLGTGLRIALGLAKGRR